MQMLQGKKWVIGVSGGPDSMGLLQMCIEAKIDIYVAHVNYGIRTQAKQEEDYVVKYCSLNQIPCFVKHAPIFKEGNFEAEARKFRYAFFLELVHKYQLDGILTAHHLDDMLETYIMQKEKHLTPSWYGIQQEIEYEGVPLVRPLLHYTKKELEQYLQDRKITYYIDHTNLLDDHTRNQIRHSRIEPMSKEEKEKMLVDIEKDNQILQVTRSEALSCIQNGRLDKGVYSSKKESVRVLALRSFLDPDLEYALTTKYLLEIDTLLRKSKDVCISYREKQIIEQNGHYLLQTPLRPFSYTLQTFQELNEPIFSFSTLGSSMEAMTLTEEDYPITIRSCIEGDMIEMRFGNKKVHRFFIDRKIPKWKRVAWPVVVNRKGKVLYVSKLGCDVEHFSDHPNTFLKVKI